MKKRVCRDASCPHSKNKMAWQCSASGSVRLTVGQMEQGGKGTVVVLFGPAWPWGGRLLGSRTI